MSRNNKKKNSDTNREHEKSSANNTLDIVKKCVVGVASIAITAYIPFSVYFFIQNWNIGNAQKENEAKIQALMERMASVEAKQDIYMQLSYNGPIVHIDENGLLANIIMNHTETEELLSIESSGVIAVGVDGTEYTRETLCEKRIVMSYIQDGKEVFFCGQFNEFGRWNGECIINVYKDNQLVLASSEVYANGKRTYYDQFFIREDKGNWIYSSRTTKDEVNSGDTWEYEENVQIEKKISFDNPDESNMVIPLNMSFNLSSNIISHYHGNTMNGVYNDQTGSAYLVTYFDDNSVKTLYVGGFKNGQFEDNTTNAWYITRDVDTMYMYYKGIFEKGVPKNYTSGEFINPISKGKVKELTNELSFSSELKWDYSYMK